jgi:hypothetical protein
MTNFNAIPAAEVARLLKTDEAHLSVIELAIVRAVKGKFPGFDPNKLALLATLETKLVGKDEFTIEVKVKKAKI